EGAAAGTGAASRDDECFGARAPPHAGAERHEPPRTGGTLVRPKDSADIQPRTVAIMLAAAVVVLAAASVYAATAPARVVGDATRGKALYQACMGCHSLRSEEHTSE